MKKKNDLLLLIPYYKKYLKLLILVIVLSLFHSFLSLFSPIYEGKLLASFTNYKEINIFKIALFLMLIKIFLAVVTHIWSTVVLKLNSSVNYDLKQDMMSKLLNLKIKNFDNSNTGIFITRINKDSNELSKFFDDITDIIAEILLNVSFIVYTFIINIYLGIFMIINVIVINIIVTKKLYHFKNNKNDYKIKDETMISTYSDIIRGIRDIKNLNLKNIILSKTNIEQTEVVLADKKIYQSARSWNRFRDIIQYLFDFLFVMISIFLIRINNLSIESFLVVYVYKKNILNLILNISEIKEIMTGAQLSAERVFEIINYTKYEKEKFGSKEIKKIDGSIKFENISFSYTQDSKLFENLNFEILPNNMYALVGRSGEGKSTVIDLINKNYTINGGNIFIDDYNLNDLTENSIRGNISTVSQEPYIFNLSIKDNVKIANICCTDEEVIEVCKKAQIHDFIMMLSDDYDTFVGENGSILSGGQKQRLAIARALIKKSKILLFDEATSSLDNESQAKIKNVMKELSKNHTVLIVAHRLSTILDADTIFVFDNHKIIEKGNHNYLMKNCEKYRTLYQNEE